MDSPTETENQAVPLDTAALPEQESAPAHKKIPFGLALVIATLLITGLLVISSYLWTFFSVTPEAETPPIPDSQQTQNN